MTELVLIMVSAILVNNFVLVQFLGLCPFMGVSKKIETAFLMDPKTQRGPYSSSLEQTPRSLPAR